MGRFSFKLALLFSLLFASLHPADAYFSPTIHIHTHFKHVFSTPSWLIIIYDADSQAVYPYLFDLLMPDNDFTIYTNALNYRIISILSFDSFQRKINNFCQFPKGVILNESMDVRVTGTLTPNPFTFQCHVWHFKN